MRIIATKVKAKELKQGDLFCTEGQSYWDLVTDCTYSACANVVGEKVYIRTPLSCPEDQAEIDIYRIIIEN